MRRLATQHGIHQFKVGLRSVFQSREFQEASRDIPNTPAGKNAYDVLGVTITRTTTWEDLSKHFRERTRESHPDHGGSHEAMAELNAARTIIKDNHERVLKKMQELGEMTKAEKTYRQGGAGGRKARDEGVSQSGGINRQNVRNMNVRSQGRSAKEIEKEWGEYRTESEELVGRMCARYESATNTCRFYHKSTIMTEITVRERWLRKTFVKGVWETVHEMRGDLLKRGARNAQQTQLAEEMVVFAGTVERRLSDNFSLLTQQSFQYQAKLNLKRFMSSAIILVVLFKALNYFRLAVTRNTLSARYAQEM